MNHLRYTNNMLSSVSIHTETPYLYEMKGLINAHLSSIKTRREINDARSESINSSYNKVVNGQSLSNYDVIAILRRYPLIDFDDNHDKYLEISKGMTKGLTSLHNDDIVSIILPIVVSEFLTSIKSKTYIERANHTSLIMDIIEYVLCQDFEKYCMELTTHVAVLMEDINSNIPLERLIDIFLNNYEEHANFISGFLSPVTNVAYHEYVDVMQSDSVIKLFQQLINRVNEHLKTQQPELYVKMVLESLNTNPSEGLRISKSMKPYITDIMSSKDINLISSLVDLAVVKAPDKSAKRYNKLLLQTTNNEVHGDDANASRLSKVFTILGV